MIIKLTKEHWQELSKKGFTLDHIFLLMLIKEGHIIDPLITDSMKLDALHQSLIRKGLITDTNVITLIGQDLLDFMATKVAKAIVKKKPSTKEFDEWWESYPSTDHFEYKGRVFTGSRGMRVQKEKCKLKFNAILNEGIYTAKDIIEATKYVVMLKKEASLKKKSNELTYLQNSYTFINDGHYIPFVELAEKGIPITNSVSNTSGGTDI